MSGSCRLDRVLNVEIGVEYQIYVIVISFFTAAEFYNLVKIKGIIRVW